MIALATVVATGSLVDSSPVSDGPMRSRPAKNAVNAIRLTNATPTIQIQPVGLELQRQAVGDQRRRR